MITEIQRTLTGVYSSANSTIIFDSNPYLQATNELVLCFENNDSKHATTVTSVSGNNAVVPFTNPQYANNRVIVKTNAFGSGLTGPQEPFSFKLSTPPNALLQVASNGGTSALTVEGSLNGTHWFTLGTMVPTVANTNTAIVSVTTPVPYGRLNISSIGAGIYLTVNKSI